MKKVLTVVAVVALTLTACGGGNKGALPNASPTPLGSKSTTSTTTKAGGGSDKPTTPTTRAGATASDQAAAEKLVLTDSDMPSGVVNSGTASTSDKSSSDALNKKVAACQGLPDPATVISVDVTGDSFTSSDSSASIGSEAQVFQSADLVANDKKQTTDSSHFSCVADAVAAAYSTATGIDPANIKASESLINGVTSKDTELALRTTLKIANPTSGNGTLYLDLLGIDQGRYELSIQLTFINAVPSATLEKSLLQAGEQHMGSISTSA